MSMVVRAGEALCSLALIAALAVPIGTTVAYAESSLPTKAPVIGCTGATLQAPPEVDDESDNEADSEEGDDHKPMLPGSVKAPPKVREGDQKTLAKYATITRDQAIKIGLDEIGNPPGRRLRQAALEVESGWLVWTIKTLLKDQKSGPDPKLDILVDAGNGQVLLIECDPNDD